ncbi:unnamed protein product [Pocillopora meandrina]|uniref:Uncharacterized protein n=1 Tax=Pocillopora meandrina TaxID=46732 RepID=A0AAU9XNR7_9CNID|nr:unnamed protein product [Pocillopora meandrina]
MRRTSFLAQMWRRFIEGVETKAALVKRFYELKVAFFSLLKGRRRKEHRTACEDNISAAANAPQPNYPSDGWYGDIKRTSFFTRVEMNNHIAKSGKNIDSSKSHSVSTSVRKATTFLNHDEYF